MPLMDFSRKNKARNFDIFWYHACNSKSHFVCWFVSPSVHCIDYSVLFVILSPSPLPHSAKVGGALLPLPITRNFYLPYFFIFQSHGSECSH